MARSNIVIGTINSLAIPLSIPVIISGLWLATEAKNACLKISQLPFLVLGILIIVVALSGAVGGFRGIQPLVVFYYFGMILVIIFLSSLVVYLCFVTALDTRGQSSIRPKLLDLSDFLQDVVSQRDKNVTTCVESSNFCAGLNHSYYTDEDYLRPPRLTTIQSGCCAPPRECNLTFVYELYPATPDSDCWRWRIEPNKLCFTCDSCKIGLLTHLNTKFKRANLILIITLISLIIVYSMGCFGLKNAKLEDLFH